YGMLSQFMGGHPGLPMLGDLDFSFPEGIHALGRLDYTSEGLLLLTTNKAMTRILFNPDAAHPRTYLVNVYRPVSDATIQQLAGGVSIRIAGQSLDPDRAIASQSKIALPPISVNGEKPIPAELHVIEWRADTKRTLYLCFANCRCGGSTGCGA
ncbi:MAG: hypothetical protein EOP51_17370, partial [Sphingobacteriales bacterium]